VLNTASTVRHQQSSPIASKGILADHRETRILEWKRSPVLAVWGEPFCNAGLYLDWVGAAIKLNPGFDEIHYMYSFYLVVMRRFGEAIAEAKQALACNPFSVRIRQHLGYSLHCARDYDEAIRQYRKTLELDPNNFSAHEALGDVYERKGQYREALDLWNKAMILAEDAELGTTPFAADAKDSFSNAVRAVATKRLERLKHRKARGDYIPTMSFARAHLRAGDREQALKCLKLACQERNVYSLMIGCDPIYDPLRTDQRFNRLLQRMKLGG
jgi:tetratricopeptide (TPR) repeat protein